MTDVDVSVVNGVARVHLNRPKSLNAITPQMDAALAEAWAMINRDPDIRVALLSGEGSRAFCAGADLGSDWSAGPARAFGGGLTGVGGPLVQLAKPLVAAVQGHAVGGGFELALCADILVISDSAKFSLPEVQRGLIAHSGILHRAMRRLPPNVAMELILTGRQLPADEAVRLGLANKMVASSELLSAALDICHTIARGPLLAVQGALQAVREGVHLPIGDALAKSYAGIKKFSNSQDAREAIEALKEKRPPVWRNA